MEVGKSVSLREERHGKGAASGSRTIFLEGKE